MEKKQLKLFTDIMNIHGISVHVWKSPYEAPRDFDSGLRGYLYEGFDYCGLIKTLAGTCREHTAYFIKDEFWVNYIILKEPPDPGQDLPVIVFAGPYLSEEGIPSLPDVAEGIKLPLYCVAQLQEYYYGVPVVKEELQLETIVISLLQYIWAGHEIFTDRREMLSGDKAGPERYRMEEEDSLAMSIIEERYRMEDELLKAVERGDADKALVYLAALSRFRVEPRINDHLRGYRNFLIVMNSLYRRAVQNARVHPAHIDKLSSSFAKRIESSAGPGELSRLHKDMIHKYCLLVQNYSLKSYSLIVQNAINYIDFNISMPMTLKGIAEKVLVNSSYLSSQFKKETGRNLTDYINQKKIEASLTLLAATDMPIHEVAEHVGIYDENYFSRLFKRSQDMTAREYRNMVKGRV